MNSYVLNFLVIFPLLWCVVNNIAHLKSNMYKKYHSIMLILNFILIVFNLYYVLLWINGG